VNLASSPKSALAACFTVPDPSVAVRVGMAELSAGDIVLSAGKDDSTPTFTRVLVTQHRVAVVTSPVMQLHHPNGTLALTPDHVLLVDGVYQAARSVTSGSVLSPSSAVQHIVYVQDAVVNPITLSSTILAAGPDGSPVLSSTHPEWIASTLLTTKVYPLPVSLASFVSFAFPSTTQAFYDAYLEPFFNTVAPMLKGFKSASPAPFLLPAFAAFDLVLLCGFVVFAAITSKVAVALFVIAAAVAVQKRFVRKA